MTHQNRNPLVTAAVDAAQQELATAGAMRDGTSVARCRAVIAIICAMRDVSPDGSARRETLQDLYSRAAETTYFCAIHDQYARREITWEAYTEALKEARESYARFDAQVHIPGLAS